MHNRLGLVSRANTAFGPLLYCEPLRESQVLTWGFRSIHVPDFSLGLYASITTHELSVSVDSTRR